ncbi:MAG TPA: hypothetical protein VM659_12595 [Dongiaceae bacterium]|nr:hypothetical protein [Dongiaceae bacterium]
MLCRKTAAIGTFNKATVTAAALVLGSLLAPTFAAAMEVSNPFGDSAIVGNAELKKIRGGVNIAGVDFDFGAVVRVYVNGPMVAETVLNLNPDGSMSRQTTISDPSIASQIGNVAQVSNGALSVAVKNGMTGFIINDANGVSLALNQIDGGNTHAFLVNTATGRQITQTVDAHLTINNFTQLNASMLADIANARAAAAGIPNSVFSR